MVFKPSCWVNESIVDLCAELEQSDYPYSVIERDCWRRLASDDRMQEIYLSTYLTKRLTLQGWRIWFDCARNVDTAGLKEERDRAKKYSQLIIALSERMEDVATLFYQIDELDMGEENHPRAMSNVLDLIDVAVENTSSLGNGALKHLFTGFVAPTLNKLRHFDSRYMPSVAQLMDALSAEVYFAQKRIKVSGVTHGDSVIGAALRSRQHAPLPEYVRAFDEAIALYDFEVGKDFLLPPEIMAIQAEVAFGSFSVDEKQVRSARKVKR